MCQKKKVMCDDVESRDMFIPIFFRVSLGVCGSTHTQLRSKTLKKLGISYLSFQQHLFFLGSR
jgi:hypothetical protein